MATSEANGTRPGGSAAQGRELYVVHFTASNISFRLPDWEATCAALKIDYTFVPTPLSLHLQRQDVSKAQASSSRVPLDDDAVESSRIYDPYRPEPQHSSWVVPESTLQSDRDARLVSSLHLVYLPSDEAARQIACRSTQVKGIYAYWAIGRTYDQVHTLLQTSPHSQAKWKAFDAIADSAEPTSWRARFFSINHTIGPREQVERIDSFAYLGFRGPIRLKRAEREWAIIEEHNFVANQEEAHLTDAGRAALEQGGGSGSRIRTKTDESGRSDSVNPEIDNSSTSGAEGQRRDDHATLLQVFVGRPVAYGEARGLIGKMDLKKRVYIGNTSMPAEQSLLMANMAMAGPGKIVYDPFAGTGSILYACAQYGASVMGSDIDARMMKGKDVDVKKGKTGLSRAASQYGLKHRILDGLGADMTQHPWRRGGLFDAIVADPPYGIRAGAKRLGKRVLARQREEAVTMPDGTFAHELPDYVAPTRPYHLLDLTRDLLDFAHYLLVKGGRLVFWLPCVNEDDGQEVEIPTRNGMRLVARSTQDFGRWSRMLITLEKISDEDAMETGRIGLRTEYGKPVELDVDRRTASDEAQEGERIRNGRTAGPDGGPELSTTTATERRYRATADMNEFRNRVYPAKHPPPPHPDGGT